MWTLRFPQDNMSANDFLYAAEERGNRENWTDHELLKVMSYTLQNGAVR